MASPRGSAPDSMRLRSNLDVAGADEADLLA
jgi:hypothetical protein